MTRQQMENKLREWQPHWNVETIKGWNDKQLKAIYIKEQKKVVSSIRISLGLPA